MHLRSAQCAPLIGTVCTSEVHSVHLGTYIYTERFSDIFFRGASPLIKKKKKKIFKLDLLTKS